MKHERDQLQNGQEAYRESLAVSLFVGDTRKKRLLLYAVLLTGMKIMTEQQHEMDSRMDHLKSTLKLRESDVGRLRGQRDAFKEDNDLRKAQQASVTKHVDEVLKLAELRAVSLIFNDLMGEKQITDEDIIMGT